MLEVRAVGYSLEFELGEGRTKWVSTVEARKFAIRVLQAAEEADKTAFADRMKFLAREAEAAKDRK